MNSQSFTPIVAAARLGLGRTKVFELIRSGELRSFAVGTRRLVSESAIADFIAKREAESAQGRSR